MKAQRALGLILLLIRKAALLVIGYAAFSATVLVRVDLPGHANGAASATYSLGDLEGLVFHGMPSVWLQRWTPDSPVVPTLAFAVWSSLFYVPLLLLGVVLAVKGSRAFLSLLAFHVALTFSADAVYALFPTRPPWMDEPVTRIIAEMTGGAVARDNNPYAAAPSLHVGVPAAFAIWFWAAGGRNFRILGAGLGAWTFVMTWAVVYTGEHFMLDALAGIAWAAGTFTLLTRVGTVGLWVRVPWLASSRALQRVPTPQSVHVREIEGERAA